MNKLNGKNKFFILLFSIIILGIVVILVVSVNLSSKNTGTTSIYNVTSNSVLFDESNNLVKVKTGGEITQSWDNKYYYSDNSGSSYSLGERTIVYDKSVETIDLFGDNHSVSDRGEVIKNTGITKIANTDDASFYKLKDRVYLIICNEIFNDDKTIFANKYLLITIDKQGNASLLNDAINIKTINPFMLTFNKYIFDVANEKLYVDETTINLKLIDGSTNEYVARTKTDTYEEADMSEFITSYNKLVNDFSQYVKNNNLRISSVNQVVNNTIIKTVNNSVTKNVAAAVTNKTNINKRISLRGAISYPTYIDVTYVVTDPEDKYQAVYLLVTGNIDGEMTTQKIILDKYDTTYRITSLDIRSEYTISLGYVEVVTEGKVSTLVDYIEDVINVRTTRCDAVISIDKITSGYVYFTFKMTDKYSLESGKIVLLANNLESRSVDINTKKALSNDGFSTKLKLDEANIFELRLEDAVFNGKSVNLNVSKKFSYESLGNN